MSRDSFFYKFFECKCHVNNFIRRPMWRLVIRRGGWFDVWILNVRLHIGSTDFSRLDVEVISMVLAVATCNICWHRAVNSPWLPDRLTLTASRISFCWSIVQIFHICSLAWHIDLQSDNSTCFRKGNASKLLFLEWN